MGGVFSSGSSNYAKQTNLNILKQRVNDINKRTLRTTPNRPLPPASRPLSSAAQRSNGGPAQSGISTSLLGASSSRAANPSRSANPRGGGKTRRRRTTRRNT
jgi:hypothetical protein